jgi:hypothetical protein
MEAAKKTVRVFLLFIVWAPYVACSRQPAAIGDCGADLSRMRLGVGTPVQAERL